MPEVMMRTSGLEVHEVPDGYIVYQGARDNVCYLNKTAAIVFEFCDGGLEADDIVARVAKIFELGASAHAEIRTCIDSLVKEGLIRSNSK
jgi:hypothetical protein